ncbi:MAG TPA: serine hydrolase [Chitinophagaceae bacterium]
MRRRKIILRSVLWLLLFVLIAGVWYAWKVFPLISGYGAKNLCSAVYLQHRDPKNVIREDLGDFPSTLGTYTLNEKDSSVTASVWGFAKRKAIYRKGLGCTLINDFSEKEIRAQQFLLPHRPDVNSDSIAWPAGNKLADSIPPSIDKVALYNVLDSAMKEKNESKPVYTRAIIVVYDGQLIAERYAPGFDKNSVMLGWSVAKSFTGAMIGVLVTQGKLNINAPAPVPEWRNTKKQAITIKQLLQQTSGLAFEEVYTRPSEVTNMLFNKGDMAAYAITRSLKYPPGTIFNYNGGNTNILSRIIRQTVGEKEYASFPYKTLFYKTDMYSMLLEPDASGTYTASSYCYGTARDFARFGLLYYNNGKWNGEQLLPENWVKESIQPSIADKRKHYGYQLWLNGLDKEGRHRWYPDVPADMFFADGYGGQDIYIIPSKKLVVVRLGLHVIDENKLLKDIISTLQ